MLLDAQATADRQVDPRDPAILVGGRTVTRGELDALVDETVSRLGRRRRLVLCPMGRDLASVVGYLAARRQGSPALLVEPDPWERSAELLDRYRPDVILHPDGDRPRLEERSAAGIHRLHPDLAVLLSTSGSTGSPKLVRLSTENLDRNAEAIARSLRLTAEDRAVTTLPLHYCYGLSVLNSHLWVGASVVLDDRSVLDEGFWTDAAGLRVTTLSVVPHGVDLLGQVRFADRRLPALRRVTVAGGRPAPAQALDLARQGRRQGWDLYLMYGQTEATARMAYVPPELVADRPDAIGVPVDGGSLRIDPLPSHLVPAGLDRPDGGDRDGVGELVYRGPNVMLGYAEHPDDLALGRTVDELRTGDLGRRGPDGLFEVVGRRNRVAKLYGLRIDLDRAERLAADRGWTVAVAAGPGCLVFAAEAPPPGGAVCGLRAALGLPPAAIDVVLVDRLPRTPSGKVDRPALDAELADRPAPGVDPDGGGLDVRTVFADVLGLEPAAVDDRDTFADLGGDSLTHVQAAAALDRSLGSLPPDWHRRPVGELEALRVSAPTTGPDADRRRRRRSVSVDPTALLRAAAIVAVVGGHIRLWHLLGGAHTLYAVAAFNFARFQLVAGRVWASLARLVVPVGIWTAGLVLFTDDFGLAHLMFLHAQLGRPDHRWALWFVEALVQTTVVAGLLLAVPAVRRLRERRPLALALGVLGAGLVIRFDLLYATEATSWRLRPDELLWLFGLGWTAALVGSTRARLALSVVAAAATWGFFADPTREAVVVAGVLVLIWFRAPVRLPSAAAAVVSAVAASSLFTYLSHWWVFPLVHHTSRPAALLASLAAGFILHQAWEAASRPLERRIRSRRGPGRPVDAVTA